MPMHTFSIFFFAWFARAWSFRVKADQEQELPWRKAFAVGAMLGTVLPAKAADALPDKFDFKNEFYDNAEKALISLLREYRSVDTRVVEKLIDSLRRSKILSDDVIQSLDAGFRGELDTPKVVAASLDGSEHRAIQQLSFPIGDGRQGVVVMHYLQHDQEVVGEHNVQDLLRSLEMISGTPSESAFLRCIAISHTSEEVAQGVGSDFMVMLEPTSGSLEEVMAAGAVDYWQRFSFFLSTFKAVQLLHDTGIPHGSDINERTVFVTGDSGNPRSLMAVLSPILVHESSAMSAIDRYDADVRQLGKLLRWLFNGSWPATVRLKNELILALGKAMEAGAFSGDHVATSELSTVMGLVYSEHSTSEEILGAKIRYLNLAVNALQPSEKRRRKAKA